MKAINTAVEIMQIAQGAANTARDVQHRFQSQDVPSTAHKGAWTDITAWITNLVAPEPVPQPRLPQPSLPTLPSDHKGKAE
jgi:hypothetical protein